MYGHLDRLWDANRTLGSRNVLYNGNFIVRVVSIRKSFSLRIVKSESTLVRAEYLYKEINLVR